MGCNGSAEVIDFNEEDRRYVRNASRAAARESNEVMVALPFVYSIHSRQSPNLEDQAVARRVLRDSISVRSFSDAPQDSTSKSVVLLFDECVETAKQKAADNLDKRLAADQLSHIGDAKKRNKVAQENLDNLCRSSMSHVFRHVMLNQKDHYEIVGEDDEELSFRDNDQEERDTRATSEGEGSSRGLVTTPSAQHAEASRPATPSSRPMTSTKAESQSAERRHPQGSPRRSSSSSPARGRKSPSRTQEKTVIEEVEQEVPLQRCTTMAPVNHHEGGNTGKNTVRNAGDEKVHALPSEGEANVNGSSGKPSSAAQTADGAGEEELPEGDWVESGDGFYWSDAECLYYHPESGMFYDDESSQWYDTATGEWFIDEQEEE